MILCSWQTLKREQQQQRYKLDLRDERLFAVLPQVILFPSSELQLFSTHLLLTCPEK